MGQSRGQRRKHKLREDVGYIRCDSSPSLSLKSRIAQHLKRDSVFVKVTITTMAFTNGLLPNI